MRIDWDSDLLDVPEGFPYYKRSRDSLRSYITNLFNTEVTMYDGGGSTKLLSAEND